MPVKQGDLNLLQHPTSRQLLESKIPARLAYVWTDGTPRVIPIWFHWNGSEFSWARHPRHRSSRLLPRIQRFRLPSTTILFPTRCFWSAGQHAWKQYTASCRSMPSRPSATSDTNRDKHGSRSLALCCQQWFASPSRRSGWGCWISRRDFPVLCRFDPTTGFLRQTNLVESLSRIESVKAC